MSVFSILCLVAPVVGFSAGNETNDYKGEKSNNPLTDTCEQDKGYNRHSDDDKKIKEGKCNEAGGLIEVVAKDGAKARISIISFEYSMFQLNGGGFKPNESLNIISTSGSEVLHFPIVADENGNLPAVGLMPAVEGKSSGECKIEILRNDAPIRIKFPWGLTQSKITSASPIR